MKNNLISTLVFGVAFTALSTSAFAGLITSQAQLSTILGGGGTMEDFEGNGLLGAGQIVDSLLNSTSTYAGYGPGLCQAGATYTSPSLFWNDNGYFGLNTRTLGDASGWRGLDTTITYTTAVTAFGFDLFGYAGFSQNGTISVYDNSNVLLTSSGVNGGFFGWENAGGIGKVVVSATTDYIMIDNHGYGRGVVPEPTSLAVIGIGAIALCLRRRKNR